MRRLATEIQEASTLPNSRSGILVDHADFDGAERPGAAAGGLEQVYRREIERIISELETLLPLHQNRVGAATCTRIQDTVAVLQACYSQSALTLPALDVLLQHLCILAQLFLHPPDAALPKAASRKTSAAAASYTHLSQEDNHVR